MTMEKTEIQPSEDALKAVPSTSLLGSWTAVEDDTPATYFSVCVAGILEGESDPSTHEGYFTGRWWQSVRWDTDKDRLLRITGVTHWCEMPPLPNMNSPEAKSE